MIICILRDRRAESPKAHSLGHRPMYSEKTSSPCKGKSIFMLELLPLQGEITNLYLPQGDALG